MGAASTKRKILYVAVTFFLCVLAVEGVTRLLTRGPRWIHPGYVEVSRGFEELDALIDDTQKMHPAPPVALSIYRERCREDSRPYRVSA